MKLSLNQKTLIIFGIFAICLLFLNNLNKDDKMFDKSIKIDEEERSKDNEKFMNISFFKNTNNNINNGSGNSDSNNSSQDDMNEDIQSDLEKLNELNEANKGKTYGIVAQSENYYKTIDNLHQTNIKEREKIQNNILENLINGRSNEELPKDNFDSYLTYNGNLLRNSLLETASHF